MSAEKPSWWSSLLPWRALNPQLPVATTSKHPVTGIVVHRQGRFGWTKGDWVNGSPDGYAVHYGLDIIGWTSDSDLHFLDKESICCSPLPGLVAWVGPDEHGYPSINLWHSSRVAERRRFSFFGDLEKVYVKAGQRVGAGTALGRPAPLRGKCRFFHFGIGYEVRRNGKWHDVFIDPSPLLPGAIVVQRELPWKED